MTDKFVWGKGDMTITRKAPKKTTTKFGWVTIDDHPVLLGDPDGHGGYGPKPPMTKGPHSKETGKTVAEIVGHSGPMSAEQAVSALAALPNREDWMNEQLQQRYPDVVAKAEQRREEYATASKGQSATAMELYRGALVAKSQAVDGLSKEYEGKVREITSSKDPANVIPASGLRATTNTMPGVEEFNRLMDSSAIPDTARPPAISDVSDYKGGRSYYDPSNNSLGMSRGADKETVVHELGHWLEEQDSDVAAATHNFLYDRTNGEKVTNMAKLYPGMGYSKDEITHVDSFYHPYVGRIYGARASEVLSMGLERMSRDPAGFAKDDPGHFKLTWNVMRGIK